MTFGTRIYKLRKGCDYTQVYFAKLCGISSGYLCRIERGLCEPSGSLLFRMCGCLDIEVGLFLWGCISIDDVPECNRALYAKTKPLVDVLVEGWFNVKSPTCF